MDMRIISVEPKRLYSVAITIVFVLSTMLASSVFLLSEMPDKSVPRELTHNNPAPVRALATTPHDPILIDGNAGFTNASGVVSGSGTAFDPYMIADWDINASTAIGISIQSTDAYFTIRNCHIYGGLFAQPFVFYDGISLSNCVNGILESNNCSQGNCGISLYSSSNNTLVNNNCSGNFDYYNQWSSRLGILLDSSSYNTLCDNNCSNNEEGIRAYSSSYNTLRENNCSSNNVTGIALEVNSNHNTLRDNTCNSNRGYGVVITFSSNDNAVSNSSCSLNNGAGMYFSFSSNNNEISSNQVFGNGWYGEYVWSGSGNRFWNNTITNNNGAGSAYDPNHVQAFDRTGNWWNSTDGYGNFWGDWTTPDLVPPFGIVDLPYDISGDAGAKDYYPLTSTPSEPIPEFGMFPFAVMVLLVAIVLISHETKRRMIL